MYPKNARAVALTCVRNSQRFSEAYREILPRAVLALSEGEAYANEVQSLTSNINILPF